MLSIKKVKKALFFSVTTFSLLSCSLNYGTEKNSEETVPEFSFTGAVFNRYEDNKISIQLEAEKLEQYKADGSSYAQAAKFKTYKEDGSLDTEGTCSLLASLTNEEKYSLFDNISINVYSEDLNIAASSLQFNGKTEQLSSSRNQKVTIRRKGTSITGTGFSASGVSHKFNFENQVSGSVQDQGSSQNQPESTEEGEPAEMPEPLAENSNQAGEQN